MADKNCEACSELQESSADFVQNGVTKDICNSLKNNTGFNKSSGHNNCTDLDDANDCLIGNMEDSIEAYDVCSWKQYTKDLVHNLWNVLKAMICSMCGLWTKVEKHDCEIQNLVNGIAFAIGEEPSDGSYVVAGQGISFLKEGSGERESDISLLYIAGGLVRVQGSLDFYHESNFTDRGYCYSFDTDASDPVYRQNRTKNVQWGNTGAYEGGGELLFEIRIKLSQYPQIRQLYAGIAGPTGGGAYQINLTTFGEGEAALGQHGHTSPTHTVPSGWLYVQARMVNNMANLSEGGRYSPRGFMGIRLNRNGIEC